MIQNILYEWEKLIIFQQKGEYERLLYDYETHKHI